ncbi:MAG: ROK family protein [Bryobacteraceae bacterium]|nr:ROK family protein [Bryobacteraceae bacterium]
MHLGIDIGGNRLKAGLVDHQGRVHNFHACATPDSLPEFRATLRALVEQAIAHQQIETAGFGSKGIIDPETTRVERLPGAWDFLEGAALRDFVADLLPAATPIRADNDAKAALAGEIAWGAARGRRNALLLTLGSGVGGAVVCDGHMLRGATHVAGHFGHILADPHGPPCMCGARGCLETVFSSRAIEAEAWSSVHQGAVSPMTRAFRADPAALTCHAIFEWAAQDDPIARWILDRRIDLFAAALAGLIHAFDPEIVILSGQIAEAGEALFAPVRRALHWRTHGLLRREVPVTGPGLNDTSGVAGAAAVGLLS